MKTRAFLSATVLLATLAGAAPAGAGQPVLDTTITAGPSGVVGVNEASFSFVSGKANARFECSLDGRAFSRCTAPAEYGDLADGPHTFSVRATQGGRVDPTPAVLEFTVATGPVVSIASPTADAVTGPVVTIIFSVAATGPVAVDCLIDGSGIDCSPEGHLQVWLPEGSHTLVVSATDSLGRTYRDAVDFTVDATGPVVVITSPTEGAVTGSTGTITFEAFDGSEIIELSCVLDGAEASLCVSPFAYTALSAGPHQIAISGRDALGNAGPTATLGFTVA